MQIDSAVVLVLPCVESHRRSPPCPRWGGYRLLDATILPRWVRREEAWMSIKPLKLTSGTDVSSQFVRKEHAARG
jgi:hypothetical protein